MKIIDAHNHIGDRRGRKGQTAEEIIAKMDASGIDQAVVFSYVPYPNNDYISESVKAYPDRLIGFGTGTGTSTIETGAERLETGYADAWLFD